MSVRALGVVIVFALGCAPPSFPEACNTNVNCGSRDGPPVLACCTLTQCAFKVADGHVYPCSGTDCHAAEMQLAAYCGQFCSPWPDAWVDPDAGDAGDASVDASLDAPACVR